MAVRKEKGKMAITNYKNITTALALNLFYFMSSIIVFYKAFSGARKKGTLINMGE